jgi:hypothetical protein
MTLMAHSPKTVGPGASTPPMRGTLRKLFDGRFLLGGGGFHHVRLLTITTITACRRKKFSPYCPALTEPLFPSFLRRSTTTRTRQRAKQQGEHHRGSKSNGHQTSTLRCETDKAGQRIDQDESVKHQHPFARRSSPHFFIPFAHSSCEDTARCSPRTAAKPKNLRVHIKSFVKFSVRRFWQSSGRFS